MATSELAKLSKQLQAALDQARKPRRTPKLGPLPADIAQLFCPTCGDFIGSDGCPKCPQQERLL